MEIRTKEEILDTVTSKFAFNKKEDGSPNVVENKIFGEEKLKLEVAIDTRDALIRIANRLEDMRLHTAAY